MSRLVAPTLITFDAGQVLVELDLDFLARRLAERDVAVTLPRLSAALPAAWAHHDALVKTGARHPWHALMTQLLVGAGVPEPAPHVDFLWSQQPTANLWRKPIVPVVAIARELAAAGHRVAVLSNSEGRIADLLAEVGIADPFCHVVDSGRLPFAKPDRRIFDHARERCDAAAPQPPQPTTTPPTTTPTTTPIHIGDSWAADVAGARAAGWRAIWYGAHVTPVDDPLIASARDADELRAALARWL